VLSINDDVLELDPAQWKTTWRKGGVGPGIFALAYLATTQTGQSYVVSVIAENRSQPLDPNTALPTSSRRPRAHSPWQRDVDMRKESRLSAAPNAHRRDRFC
jgi:hypothetical protein